LPHLYSPFFTSFKSVVDATSIPDCFILQTEDDAPHPLSLLAAQELQQHIQTQTDWEHNFGLSDQSNSNIVGKMFGVLVVQNAQNEVGYLSAFSGKLAGGNHHPRFVPPVFDLLTQGSFLNNGMQALTELINELKLLEANDPENIAAINQLKKNRKQHSINLQQEIFNRYSFINQNGDTKNINDIFKQASYKNPPAGAGECAAPKLLQYAFLHQLKPLALAEFWWGQSPKSVNWKHGTFYPCCKEKCEPILAHMLHGLGKNSL
jgi:tRNA pseudouridine32 synthase/23S rRNA pseudouridine746 synthase